ncbi:unnamed protein product [Diamesa serratosioi]
MKDGLDSDSVASAVEDVAKDDDFKQNDSDASPESASEVDSTKAKKSPKKSPKKKASKKTKKTKKKSPVKAVSRKSVSPVEEKDPLSNTDDEAEPEEEYEVEAIVGHREYNRKLVYKIRWKGYGAASDTWEAADSLSCPDILESYNFKNKIKATKRSSDVSSKTKTKKRKISDSGNDDDEASEEEEAADSDDYEVDKLVEVRKKRDGSREFLVRWKKWSSKYDTWEPENNLSCPELIEKFMAQNVDVVKKGSTKALRATPKARKSITFSTQNDKRRSSKRNAVKGKITYNEDD